MPVDEPRCVPVELPRWCNPPPPLASFFGFKSRTLMVFFFVFGIFNFPVLGCLLVHRTTTDARPRHSVLGSGHRDGSIFPSCALAFDSLTLRRAHFFCSSVHSLRWPITSIRAKLFQRGIFAALLVCVQRLTQINISRVEDRLQHEGVVLRPRWSIDESPVCFDSEPHSGDAVQAWPEKCRAVLLCAAGYDWLGRKQTRHAV